jgi:hypothetical protein
MTETPTVTSARTRIQSARDARGRFAARVGCAARMPRTSRVRTLPARDARGRFVAFPTSQAPSWYVLCVDGFRIPGEPPATSLPVIAPAAPHGLPRAIVHAPCPRFTRSQWQSALLILLLVLVSAWYGFISRRRIGNASVRGSPTTRASPISRAGSRACAPPLPTSFVPPRASPRSLRYSRSCKPTPEAYISSKSKRSERAHTGRLGTTSTPRASHRTPDLVHRWRESRRDQCRRSSSPSGPRTASPDGSRGGGLPSSVPASSLKYATNSPQ